MKRSAKLYKAKCKNLVQTDTNKEHFRQDETGDYMSFLPLTSENLSDNIGSNSVSEIFNCPTEISDVQILIIL